MKIESADIDGIFLLTPERRGDERGWLMEVYRSDLLADVGIIADFVQDNQIFSAKRGTVRGLHFQASPRAQAKLVRCTRGAVFDVAVDLRRDSANFGRHVAFELRADKGNSLFVPAGFAHGFCTLTPDCETVFKLTAYHAPDYAGGMLWCDPALNINWPVHVEEAIVSEGDRRLPPLAELISGLP